MNNPAAAILLCSGAIVLMSCTYGMPPQTGSYCIDIPDGKTTEASRFAKTVADQLNFKVSEAQFASEKGPPNQVWELHGRGVSMFVGTAMKDGEPDRFGNKDTTFNQNRLGFVVVKTGLWQQVRFEKVVAIAESTARQLGWRFTTAASGKSCST